jgi:tetrahydromethanopterin S-methyltransferase subunit H
LFKFQTAQKTFRISGTDFGSQPGKGRTVMVASLFYPGHGLVEDRQSGRLRLEDLRKKVEACEETSRTLGQPVAYMLYSETEAAARRYLETMADLTGAPLFLESPRMEVKRAGMAAGAGMGISERLVYNSLNAGSSEEEWSSLRENGVDSAVIMAFNPADMSTKGRIYLLDDGGDLIKEGLLQKAERHGIARPLLDTAATGFDQMAGSSLRALMVAKAKWGLPCGCALHNSVETWPPFQDMDEEKRKLFRYVDLAAVTLPISSGADFVMFGPVETASRALHVAAFTDGIMSQSTSEI